MGELLEKEHLVFDTKNPFSFAVMHVYLKEHEWYLAKEKEGKLRLSYKEFAGEKSAFFGVNGAVIPCGEETRTAFDFCMERQA